MIQKLYIVIIIASFSFSQCLKGNCIVGEGTSKSDEGIYEGKFNVSKYNGLGEMTYNDGSVYTGSWFNNQKHGQGTLTLPDGRKYVGEFKDGKGNGQGTYTYSNGNQYVGEFKDGDRNGQGTLTYSDGSTYVGGFKDDRKHGYGILIKKGSKKTDLDSGVWYDGNLIERLSFIESVKFIQSKYPNCELLKPYYIN